LTAFLATDFAQQSIDGSAIGRMLKAAQTERERADVGAFDVTAGVPRDIDKSEVAAVC